MQTNSTTRRGLTTVVAAPAVALALSVSIIGPSRLADGVTALLLFALHFVTAAVVIVGLTATLPLRGRVPASEG